MQWRGFFVLFIWLIWPWTGWSIETVYNPLTVPTNTPVQVLDLVVKGQARQREIPVRVHLPSNNSAMPVVLFSHGLGGSREGNPFLGTHWAARGYVAVFLQHPGSDDSIWRGKSAIEGLADARLAASSTNLRLRAEDVSAVLDQLEQWNNNPKHPLAGRMNLHKIGMSGHSFGAVTTQAVSGENFPIIGQKYTDSRIQAAIAFSPSAPRAGNPARVFGSVKVPWLLMTGTEDNSPINNTVVDDRLAVFPNLKGAPKYEVVLAGAEHSAFTDRPLPGERQSRNPNHHRVILALSTAFWDAYLKDEPAAKAWLNGAGPHSVMESDDRWQSQP